MNLTHSKKLLLSGVLAAGLALQGFSQTKNCGGSFSTGNASQRMLSSCTSGSAAYLAKYRTQNYWVPTSNDPVITLKITLHIFRPVNPNNNPAWLDTPSGYFGTDRLWRFLSDPTVPSTFNAPALSVEGPIINGQTERFSDQRAADYPDAPVLGYISDSRIQYEVTNIYFYTNDNLYTYDALSNGGDAATLCNYINAIDPARLKEGLPIIIKGNSGPFASSYNGAPVIVTNAGAHEVEYFRSNLRHEIGHCFDLMHTYQNIGAAGYSTGSPICCAEPLDCTNPDFLDDVFPTNSGICASPQAPCNTCYEWWNVSNNMMGAGPLMPRQWMSPLQMGRRIRNMHLAQGTNIRVFAKDCYSQHTDPLLITQNEVWDFDIQMYRDIVVKPGAKLTITCKVAMAIEGKIKVEKGAQLVIDGGEVTGWCKSGLWGNIQVEGDANYAQSVSGSGFSTYHGVLRIINGGKVSRSGTAVTNYFTGNANDIQWATLGGIIIGNGGIFENNSRDVEFLTFPNFPSISKFENCTFVTSGAIGQSQPNVTAVPYAHVTLWGINNVQFKGCRFEYAAGNMYPVANRGMGIGSIDAGYTVDQLSGNHSKFLNLKSGVYVGNFNPLSVVTVRNSEFLYNEEDGVHFENMRNFVLENNVFITPGNGSTTCGLYLDKCKGYQVRNNSFTQAGQIPQSDVGIHIYDSKDWSHEIYRNSFSNFLIGIAPQGNNSGIQNMSDGLRMNCNNFAAGASNQYDIAMMDVLNDPATASLWQSNFNNTDPLGLVRNIYGAGSICSTCESRWYVDWTSSKQMFHYNHNDANTRITPQPEFSDASLLAVNVSHMTMDYANHCPEMQAGLSNAVGTAIPGRLNSYITSLRANNTYGQNNHEIGAAVSAKLNFFLTDSVYQNQDSVLHVFSQNQGSMSDADVMTAFALMQKRDFVKAEWAINSLPVNKQDWKALLEKMLYLTKNPADLYYLRKNGSLYSFFDTYASTQGMDGQGCAKGAMEMMGGKFYAVPRLAPDSKGFRATLSGAVQDSDSEISVFPNPARDVVTVSYKNAEEGTVHIMLSDMQGRTVYEDRLSAGSDLKISLNGLAEGIYMLHADKDNKAIHRTKVVLIR